MNTDMHTEALRAHFRVFQSTVRKSGMHPVESTPGVKRVDEYVRASVLRPARIGGDRVEISLSARMTVEAANGIAQDSMVEQINKAIQEAGIDLSVEGARDAGLDLSPEATAKRISEFALGYRNAFDEIHVGESAETRITGFLSMIRGAIQEGFQHARQFLEGITKLSETVDKNISKTFELTNQYLDAFHQAQLDQLQNEEGGATGEPSSNTQAGEEV